MYGLGQEVNLPSLGTESETVQGFMDIMFIKNLAHIIKPQLSLEATH